MGRLLKRRGIMPIRELKRIWCKTCNEFELHQQNYPNWEDWFCLECETCYTSTLLKDIPEEKILEQRERYKVSTRYDFNRVLSTMLLPGTGLDHMFSSDPETHIMESDAGQRVIDKEVRRRKEEEYEKRVIVRDAEIAEKKKYQGTGRNEECLCGSGLKYKKCCWERIQKIR